MNFKKIEKLLKKATNSHLKSISDCDDLANYFQPYFNEEISVLYQQGDEFVVLYDEENHFNDTISEVFKNISKNINHYK